MLCAYCNSKVKEDKRSLFPVSALQFCSERCLLEHIHSKRRDSIYLNELIKTKVALNTEDFANRNCFSIRLGMAFRSWFECHVAEELTLNKCLTLYYEPHQLRIDDNHIYVPDFWLPNFGVWLEVKGEWRNGAKNKFCKALDILGADRLILIPTPYKNWFRPRRRVRI